MQLNPADMHGLQYSARTMVDQMALAFEASLLVRHAPSAVSEAFCASRLAAQGHHNYGALPKGMNVKAIIERADPAVEKA
jgi:putative acyl-CoA dehydrogenase